MQTSTDAAHGSIKSDMSQYAIEQIKDAGEKAARLTRQLLAFSRKQVLQLKIVDLNETIDNLSKMLRRLIGEDIELSLALTQGLHKVNADPGQIEQVIMNLAVNSREAMPNGGKLIIETHDIFLDYSYAHHHLEVQPGSYSMIAISDTGIGIPPEAINLIFEPFFTTKETGTGLGLATVYGIIKQSGGHIQVYSEQGLGTTFKIYLPHAVADAPDPEPKESKSLASISQGTILLVEDEGVVRNLCYEFLCRSGYTVLIADCGAEALKLVQLYTGRLDLLITDMIMPGMNGRDLAKKVRKIYPDIGILFMSGYTDVDILDIESFDGRTLFINKPFASVTLLENVNQILKNMPIQV